MNPLQKILNQINKQNADFQNISILKKSKQIENLNTIREIAIDLLKQTQAIDKTDSRAISFDIKGTIKKCNLLRLKADWNINAINGFSAANYSTLKDIITNNEWSDLDLFEFLMEVGINVSWGGWFVNNGKPTDLLQLLEKNRNCTITNFFKKNKAIYDAKQEEQRALRDQEFINLLKDVLNNKDKTKIQELKTIMTSMKLTRMNLEKFLTMKGITNADARKIVDLIPWNHGDVMDEGEINYLLAKARSGIWVLRECPNTHRYRIMKKDDYYYVDSDLPMTREKILKGGSRDYKLWDMLVSEEILLTHPYSYGKISNLEAEQKLKGTPIGSWLFHFSENDQQFAFSIQMGSDTYKHILVAKERCQRTSLRVLFEEVNKVVKTINHVGMRQNIAGIPVEFLDPKQAEQKVTELFKTTMCLDRKLADKFKSQGFTKLSRRKFRMLPTSFLIEDKGNQAIGIHQMIHGPGAFLGKGTWKIAKVMQNIDSSKRNLVISRYYSLKTLEKVETEFPELRQILEILRKMHFIAEGHLISLGDKAFFISEYAKTTLDKLIKNGLTDDQKKKYALHLLKGLVLLHQNHIAHRDIKPDNINIIENAQTHEEEACHADLDFATRLERPPIPKGTPLYEAPEFLRVENCSFQDLEKIDVYAMGMTLYEIYHGKHWWYDPAIGDTGTNLDFYNRLFNITETEYLQIFPEPAKDTVDHLIWQMLHPDPKLRPTAKEALVQFEKIA